MINRQVNPKLLNEFLNYNTTIKNKSLGTVSEYNYDLKHFLQYLVYRFNNDSLTKEAQISFDSGFSLGDSIKTINITNINLDFIKKIQLEDIHSFLYYLKSEYKLKPASLARKVAAVRSFFNYLCLVRNLLEVNPTTSLESPKLDKRLPKHLDLKQSMKLLEVIKEPSSNSKISEKLISRNFAIITLFLNCGMRLSELVGINIPNINFFDNTLTIIGKGNKERSIYLNKACIKAIQAYLKDRPTDVITKDKDALFISDRKSRISKRMVQHIVKTELKKAGINTDEFSTHKLRHTAATLMYQYGDVDIRALQQVLGHESISTTEIYTHVNNEQVREALSKNPLADLDS